MATRVGGGPWASGMRANVCSLAQRILTAERLDDGRLRIRNVRMRNPQDPKEWIGLPGYLEPMSDKTWRTFVKQRREVLFGKEESAS